MGRDNVIVGLDIGTTKIAALVAESNEHDGFKIRCSSGCRVDGG